MSVTAGAEEVVKVALGSIKPHPRNPRIGDVAAIADSLRAHGQYRPIVVQRSTRLVLAGNHTAKAARSLGWTHLDAVLVDVDEEAGHVIMLADNRTADLAVYDGGRLSELLADTGEELSSSGYSPDDVDHLADVGSGSAGADRREDDGKTSTERVKVGRFSIAVDEEELAAWVLRAGSGEAALDDAQARLLIPDPQLPGPAPQPAGSLVAETVALGDLFLHEGNARQGDVGVIAESLLVSGQYRPVVVDQRNVVLVGNHTVTAASMLGLTHVVVVRVEVTKQEAAAIVAVDNRTSDLATYDDQRLTQLLADLGDLSGTGFDGDDLDDLMSGRSTFQPLPPAAPTTLRLGRLKRHIDATQYAGWFATLTDPTNHTAVKDAILTRLNMEAQA